MKFLAKTILLAVVLLGICHTAEAKDKHVKIDRNAEILACDILARTFDSPFGVRNLAYSFLIDYNKMYDPDETEPVDDDLILSVYQALVSNGCTPDKGFDIQFIPLILDEDGDDGGFSKLEITIPNDYAFPVNGLHPSKAIITRSPETVRVQYFFDDKDNKQDVAARFRKLFKEVYAGRTDESDENFQVYENYVRDFVILRLPETTTVSADYKRSLSWFNIPAGYYPDTKWEQLPAAGPYNSGTEPFATFLKKFNADTEFRNERTTDSDYGNHDQRLKYNYEISWGPMNQMVLKAAVQCGLFPVQGRAIKNPKQPVSSSDYVDYYVVGEWFAPTSDKVIYSGLDRRRCDEYETNSVMLLFERFKDGKWYCTATHYFGTPMDDAVREQMEQWKQRNQEE